MPRYVVALVHARTHAVEEASVDAADETIAIAEARRVIARRAAADPYDFHPYRCDIEETPPPVVRPDRPPAPGTRVVVSVTETPPARLRKPVLSDAVGGVEGGPPRTRSFSGAGRPANPGAVFRVPARPAPPAAVTRAIKGTVVARSLLTGTVDVHCGDRVERAVPLDRLQLDTAPAAGNVKTGAAA